MLLQWGFTMAERQVVAMLLLQMKQLKDGMLALKHAIDQLGKDEKDLKESLSKFMVDTNDRLTEVEQAIKLDRLCQTYLNDIENEFGDPSMDVDFDVVGKTGKAQS